MLATCRRGWALCLFIAVAFLLIYTVPALISLQEIAESRDYSIAHGYGLTSDVLKYADEQAKELADMMSQGAVIVSMIAAVFAGCYSLLFLQNKTSSAFYHSLPERRSGHFITALFTAFSTYLAAFLINFIISAITFAAYGLMFPELFAGLLAGFATAVFFFAAMLSVTFLAGTLTGNLVMHVIVTGIFTFILPVLFASVILLLSQGAEYFQPSSLYSELLLSLMSPFIAGFRAAFAD